MQELLVKTREAVGDRFGRLEIIGRAFRVRTSAEAYTVVVCQCDCGNVTISRVRMLRRGTKVSCGCYMAESRHRPNPHRKYNIVKKRNAARHDRGAGEGDLRSTGEGANERRRQVRGKRQAATGYGKFTIPYRVST